LEIKLEIKLNEMLTVHKRWRIYVSILLALLPVLTHCSRQPTPSPIIQNNALAAPPKECGNSSIAGVVTLKGGASWGLIDMSSDPVCAQANRDEINSDLGRSKLRTESVVVNDRWKLANTLIFLKSKQLDSCKIPTPTDGKPLTLQDCRFVPHVIGLQSDQTLILRNSDNTDHQFCVSPAYNPAGCIVLKPGEMNTQKKFPAAERFIQISCSHHPWEKAYLAVFGNPFFAVSDKDGRYEIKGIPPGEYTIVAWHEYYGERTSHITIGSNQTKNVDFTIDEMISAEALAKPVEKSPEEMIDAVVYKVEAVYPERAGKFRQDGEVEIRVMLDEEGNVTHAFGLAGYPMLQDSAEVAALSWKFKPTIRNGAPVKVIGSILFNFKIPDNIAPPSTTHYEMSESDKVNQYFGPLTYPFSVTIVMKSKSWNPAEPLVADVDFKNTTDKIVLLDLKRRYYFSAHLTDSKRTYGILWDKRGSGETPQKEDYTELAPGASHRVTLTSTRILDAGEGIPWSSHTAGKYRLALFYVSTAQKPSFPGEWVGQAMSKEVVLQVDECGRR
jgi:TonB family protein